MIKKEYDNIDELVQDDYCEKNDYETAKEANDLLMDALQLTEVQKTMLKGSYAFLEELHRKQILSQFVADPKTVTVGKNTFRYDDKVYGDTRGITGQEITDWIVRNHMQDLSVYCGTECLFVRMVDIKDELHYREKYLNWRTDHSMYETLEDWLEQE